MRRIKEEDFEIGKKVQELFHLEKAPATIDCFDISHFQSRYIVGACIRFTNGVPDKNSFRRFKIRTLKEQNDYAALQEVVTRRYKNPAEIPDLSSLMAALANYMLLKKFYRMHKL